MTTTESNIRDLTAGLLEGIAQDEGIAFFEDLSDDEQDNTVTNALAVPGVREYVEGFASGVTTDDVNDDLWLAVSCVFSSTAKREPINNHSPRYTGYCMKCGSIWVWDIPEGSDQQDPLRCPSCGTVGQHRV